MGSQSRSVSPARPFAMSATWRPINSRSLMDRDSFFKRLRFRAWHRGTKEADLLIGGYFDRYSAAWSDEEAAWFEILLEEQDVDIMAWAIGTAAPPERYQGEMMRRLQILDYIKHPE